MKFFIGLAMAFLFCGCTNVEFVRQDLSPKKQGVLRYSPPSSESGEAKYREEVNNKAKEFCGGSFTITKEYQALDQSRSTAAVGTGIGGLRSI